MEERPEVAGGYVVVLGAKDAGPASVGGKAASLSRLIGTGHRVPPGIAITVDAFEDTIDALGLRASLTGLDEALANGVGAEALSERIHRALLDGRLPEPLAHAIRQETERLEPWGAGQAVIVRSSATVEDSINQSFAGIFESIVIHRPDELEPTIRSVWASGFSPRAVAYVVESGQRAMPRMGVVIQRFLEAERSGVMFTRFPGPTGRPSVLIEHVEGGCEKLVKGEVTPDRLWVDGDEAPEGPSSLPVEHVRELARVAGDLEGLFGGHQDVEWCVFEDQIHILQSRPITASLQQPAPVGTTEGLAPVLSGVGASPGVGSGPVHLAFNIQDALELQAGQVLVTPMTNPDMVVAMRNSAAVVTDVGGMICHAAIVSRELGLPCVVGTETATRSLSNDRVVSVDGAAGAVYEGALTFEAPTAHRPAEWRDLWNVWQGVAHDAGEILPAISSADALDSVPAELQEVVVIPDVDLRCDERGLWRDLDGLSQTERRSLITDWLRGVGAAARRSDLRHVWIAPLGGVPEPDLERSVRALGDRLIRILDPAVDDVAVYSAAHEEGPQRRAAVPLGVAAALWGGSRGLDQTPRLAPLEESISAARDTLKFFGHSPAVTRASMPDPEGRQMWWRLLPEYGRFHAENATRLAEGEYDWLEVRPELVISALLKSLVQPGFEMVPRVLGFRHLPPMHIKWIRGRYHFRGDVFTDVWSAIVQLTWDTPGMAALMRRVRSSYRALEEVLLLFPDSDQGMRSLSPERIVALITSWWPRWVEFFSLCWFIQAQGDDIIYPFIQESVEEHLSRLPDPPDDFSWPGLPEFSLPTTPVLSADFMRDVAVLRKLLDDSGLTTATEALAVLDEPAFTTVRDRLDDHLMKWFWMRDRDLVFEPWDTRERVLDTVLKTEPHLPAPYDENLRRAKLALSFHFDLALVSGRAGVLNHAGRFFHDLTVERENHHVLWLKFSYPLRRLFLESERRFIETGSLRPGDVFFLQAPELIEAIKRLPEPLRADLVARVRNRRRAFQREARLGEDDGPAAEREDDYY